MQRSPDSELRARWLQPSAHSQELMIRGTPVRTDNTAPLLLGLRGTKYQIEHNVEVLVFTINQALWSQRNADMPVYDVYDEVGQLTDNVALDFGMMKLSYYHNFENLGRTKEGLLFIKNSDCSQEEYWASVNSLITHTNRILVSEGSRPLPTPGEYLYPIDEKIKF